RMIRNPPFQALGSNPPASAGRLLEAQVWAAPVAWPRTPARCRRRCLRPPRALGGQDEIDPSPRFEKQKAHPTRASPPRFGAPSLQAEDPVAGHLLFSAGWLVPRLCHTGANLQAL